MERKSFRNIYTRVHFNPKNDYSIKLEGYSEAVNNGLSEACRKVAQMGDLSGTEHLYLVNLETGTLDYYETNDLEGAVGFEFWTYVDENPSVSFAFVHNHNYAGYFSETDLRTLLTTENIIVMIAVCNDGVKYVAERSNGVVASIDYDTMYADDLKDLNRKSKNDIIYANERTLLREQLIVNNLLRDFTKGKGAVEYDGRK